MNFLGLMHIYFMLNFPSSYTSGFFWEVFLFRVIYSSGLGTVCSFSVCILGLGECFVHLEVLKD